MLPLLEKIIAVKKPAQGLPQSLLDAYEAIGKADGFQIEKAEKGLIFTGKTVKVALKVEFGNRWEFFNAITALRETPADIKVIITSSNVKSIKMEAVYTVLKKKLEEKGRWVIIDIEGKKPPMKLNFARPRPEGKNAPRAQRQRQPPQPGETALWQQPAREGSSRQEPQPREAPQEPQYAEERPAQAQPEKKKPFSFLERLPFFGKSARKEEEPVKMVKTKNYGMQPADAKPRRKKIYGKRRKGQD